jgi:beta-mannosidase
MNKHFLHGTWTLSSPSLAIACEGMVPGSIYGDLLRNNLMEDPFYRDNEFKVCALMEHDFSYQRTFEIDTIDDSLQTVLVCEGLDTLAQVYLNKKHIASTNNMHRTYRIDVTNLLRVGVNHIRIDILSPIQFMKQKEQERTYPLFQNKDTIKGYIHLRKGSSMMGWDWGPKLPDGGIWRSIYLETVHQARIESLMIHQIHQEENVLLRIAPQLVTRVEAPLDLLCIIKDSQGSIVHSSMFPVIGTPSFDVMIHDAKKWYPCGYGAQELYTIDCMLFSNGVKIDEQFKRIGLREITVKRQEDIYGQSFTFVCNGIEIFARGANYIPEDNLLSRTNKLLTLDLLTLAKEASHNMIRVWGGGIYPEDYFYDICDELGLLVWQDLMFACSVYDMDDLDFVETMKVEIIDNLKRIRHHACLALICGNNENETAIEHWNVPSLERSKEYYIRHYVTTIQPIVSTYAPHVVYWVSSPSSGKTPFEGSNSDHFGDMHYWGVWHNNEPIHYYRHYFPRFMSEFGIQSFPSLRTVESFTKEMDRNIFSYVMEVHQKNNTANDKILNYIGKMFQYPKDFNSLLYVSQLIQAEGIRYGVEHWRRHRGQCMGAIYWQLNDCYPVASWSSIDYFHRPKALYYHSKKFFSDVLISIEETPNQANIHLSNESLQEIRGVFHLEWMDVDGMIIEERSHEVTIPAQTSFIVEHFSTTLEYHQLMDKVLVVEFVEKSGQRVSNQVSFVPDKHLSLKKPQIKTLVHLENQTLTIELSTDTLAKYVEIGHNFKDIRANDQYFHLFPDKPILIEIPWKDSVEEFIHGLQLRSLVDTYL